LPTHAKLVLAATKEKPDEQEEVIQKGKKFVKK